MAKSGVGKNFMIKRIALKLGVSARELFWGFFFGGGGGFRHQCEKK